MNFKTVVIDDGGNSEETFFKLLQFICIHRKKIVNILFFNCFEPIKT